MWHNIFHLEPSVLEKVIRPIFIYIFLLVGLRLGGRREFSQLNMLDFIVLLAVANAVQNGIIGQDDSVSGALIGASSLLLVNGIAVLLTRHSRGMRRLLIGSESVLIKDGLAYDRSIRRERLGPEDIHQAITEAGGRSIEEVELCVIEPNGHIVVRLKPNDHGTAQFAQLMNRIDELEQKLLGKE
ncbi:MAG: YetF domain-containing protein [Actinomycetes bacterium]